MLHVKFHSSGVYLTSNSLALPISIFVVILLHFFNLFLFIVKSFGHLRCCKAPGAQITIFHSKNKSIKLHTHRPNIGLSWGTVEIWTYFMIFKWVANTVNNVTTLYFFELTIKMRGIATNTNCQLVCALLIALHSRISISNFHDITLTILSPSCNDSYNA